MVRKTASLVCCLFFVSSPVIYPLSTRAANFPPGEKESFSPSPEKDAAKTLTPIQSEQLSALFQNGDYQGAVKHLTQWLREAPHLYSDLEVRLLFGISLKRTGSCKNAVIHLKEAAQHDLLSSVAIFALMICHADLDHHEEVIRWGSERLKQKISAPLKRRLQRAIGVAHYRNREWEKAVSHLREGGAEIPRFSLDAKEKRERESVLWSIWTLADALEQLGRKEEAVSYLRKVSVEAPESAIAAQCIKKLDMSGIALTAPEQLLRAKRFFSAFDYASAIAELRSLNPGSPKSTTFWGRSPMDEEAELLLAKALYSARRFTESASQAKNLYQQAPSAEAKYWLARSLASAGKEEEAITLYTRIANKFPRSLLAPESLYRAAGLAYTLKQGERARRLWQRVIRDFGNSNWVDSSGWFLGWAYYAEKDFQHARKWFEYVEVNFPKTGLRPQIRYWLAQTLMKMEEKEQAIALLRGISDLSPLTIYHFLASRLLLQWEGKSGIPSLLYKPQAQTGEVWQGAKKSRAKEMAKIDALVSIGLMEEAREELDNLTAQSLPKDDWLWTAHLYGRAGDYHKGMLIILNHFPHHLETFSKEHKSWKLAYPEAYRPLIERHCQTLDMDPLLPLSLMRAESQFLPHALSPSGALGLLQLLPQTGREVASLKTLSLKDDQDLVSPKKNIQLACHYLKGLLDLFKDWPSLAIPSYNAGPKAVVKWLERFPGMPLDEFLEMIPYRETRLYYKNVLRNYAVYQYLYGEDSIFYDFLRTPSTRAAAPQ
ncbi:MAG: transglycosylase SLT domain-containing protein [Deltaproteobacteria bacterium]|nr:transglycosylase SLT domain-containing protein [Deltaproteobacteria bacterium]